MASQTLQAINYSRGSLELLDQLKLPHQSTYVRIQNCEDAFDAIKRMVVRGAPAIAIVAALSLAVELSNSEAINLSREDAITFIRRKLDYLVQSRPTAVNLADTARKLNSLIKEVAGEGNAVVERYVEAAERMLVDDVADNKAIGDYGARWILEEAADGGDVRVLTHCNTGSLATAGYGTALGIIRSLHAQGKLEHVYCTETRPYNQGARLTAYELVYEKMPATLITDSMVAFLASKHRVSAIIVGADRVACNGDTANKIGTHQLAIIAKYHGIKFIVAAPTTSIDLNTACGEDIVIEERPGREVVTISGPRVNGWSDSEGTAILDLDKIETISTAARDIGIFNPAFDVTPKELVDAVVTERGVAVKNENGEFEFEKMLS